MAKIFPPVASSIRFALIADGFSCHEAIRKPMAAERHTNGLTPAGHRPER